MVIYPWCSLITFLDLFCGKAHALGFLVQLKLPFILHTLLYSRLLYAKLHFVQSWTRWEHGIGLWFMDNLLRKKKAQLNPSACCGDCIAIICMKLLICSHPPYPIFFTPHLKFKFSYNSVHKILETFFSDQNILRNYMEISFFFSFLRSLQDFYFLIFL